MSQRQCCCQDLSNYQILQPCYNQSATTVYMSTADFLTCGLEFGKIYKNGYCGYFQPSSTVGDTLDNTCSNYTENDAGCCGTAFDPCPDNETCCGFYRCMDYKEDNSQPVPLNISGYIATTGAAGNKWTAQVSSVTVGTPTFYNAGYPDFRYLVSGNVTVTFQRGPGGVGAPTCDGQSKPPTRTVPFQFYVVHDTASLSCPSTATADSTSDLCDYSVSICPGTTSQGGSSFTDCSILVCDTPASPSMTTPPPFFHDDCRSSGMNYRIALPMTVYMSASNPAVDNCIPGCTNSVWTSAYFPDNSASFDLTILGIWS